MTPGSFASYPPEPNDWGASLRSRMFDQRVVFITGNLTDEVAGRAAMELMTLDATGDSVVQLHLESPSGDECRRARCDRAEQRGGREPGHAGQEDTAASIAIAERPAEEQEAGQRDRVAVHDPLQA